MTKSDQARQLARDTNMTIAEIATHLGVHYSQAHQAIKSMQPEKLVNYSKMVREKTQVQTLSALKALISNGDHPQYRLLMRKWLASRIAYEHWKETLLDLVASSVSWDQQTIRISAVQSKLSPNGPFETVNQIEDSEVRYVFAICLGVEATCFEKGMDKVIEIKVQDLYDSL